MEVNTVKRVFSSVRSIVNLVISEEGLACSNGFAKTYFLKDNKPFIPKPIPIEKIKVIQSICFTKMILDWMIEKKRSVYYFSKKFSFYTHINPLLFCKFGCQKY